MKVYNYVSHWHNGVKFEGDIKAKVFKTIEEAKRALNEDTEYAINRITAKYDSYYQDSENHNTETYHLIGDNDEYQNDWWEGFIIWQEL